MKLALSLALALSTASLVIGCATSTAPRASTAPATCPQQANGGTTPAPVPSATVAFDIPQDYRWAAP